MLNISYCQQIPWWQQHQQWIIWRLIDLPLRKHIVGFSPVNQKATDHLKKKSFFRQRSHEVNTALNPAIMGVCWVFRSDNNVMKNIIPKQDAQVWTPNAVTKQMEDIDVKTNWIWERKLSYQEKKLGNKIVISKNNRGNRGWNLKTWDIN